MSEPTQEEIMRVFKQYARQRITSKDLQGIDPSEVRFDQIGEGVVLVGVLHPIGHCDQESDLRELADATDLFYQIVVTNVMNCNGMLFRTLGSSLLCAFGGPPVAAKEIPHVRNAFLAINNICAEITTLNRQRASESKKALNTGFGVTYGKLLGGIRGFRNFVGYELVGGEVYLADALAHMAQEGQCFTNAEFVSLILKQDNSHPTQQIQLTNGTVHTIYRIMPAETS